MEDDSNDESLKQCFEKFRRNYETIKNGALVGGNEEKRKNIMQTICRGERILLLTNQLNLFSSNEMFDEIQTPYLLFLSVPAFIGNLYFLLPPKDRNDELKKSKAFYKLFFSYLLNYECLEKNYLSKITELIEEKNLSTCDPFKAREEKISHFKTQKEIKEKIKALEKRLSTDVNQEDGDELLRECYTLQLFYLSIESMSTFFTILEEEKMLHKVSSLKNDSPSFTDPTNFQKDDFVFIRLDRIKKVFGYGYPSLPTMTQDEYLQHELATGKILREYNPPPKKSIDEDDEKEVEAKREKEIKWDMFKDDHRRGSGNRYNHG